MRFASLSLAAILLVASPAAGQIGINGSRQAATTGDMEISLNALSRCGRSSREANALAGRAARGVEREQFAMTYRRYRYADSGLSDAEEEALARQEQRIEDAARSGYRRSYAESPGLRRYGWARQRGADQSCTGAPGVRPAHDEPRRNRSRR